MTGIFNLIRGERTAPLLLASSSRKSPSCAIISISKRLIRALLADLTGLTIPAGMVCKVQRQVAGATTFRIAPSCGVDALHALVGEPIEPVIISDHFGTYARAPERQTCWAHLRRISSR